MYFDDSFTVMGLDGQDYFVELDGYKEFDNEEEKYYTYFDNINIQNAIGLDFIKQDNPKLYGDLIKQIENREYEVSDE